MNHTIKRFTSGFYSEVRCDEGDYVAVTYKGEREFGYIDTIFPDGVFITIDLCRRDFYDFADIEPLTDDELEQL